MKRTVITLLFLVVALAAFAGGLLINAIASPAHAAAFPSLQDEQEEQEEAAATDNSDDAEVTQLTRIADALTAMAEKGAKLDEIAASMTAIVERLAAIEEELAWNRLDSQEEDEEQ